MHTASLRAPALLVALSWALPVAAGQPAADAAGWHDVRVPGGVDALARAGGLAPPIDRSMLVVELVRRLHGTPAGAADAAAATLRERVGEALAVGAPTGVSSGEAAAAGTETVPLRLAPSLWARAVFDGRLADADVLRGILTERRPALFYHGVAGLDAPTLAWLSEDPARLSGLFERHAELFAAFGRSVHVDGGRIVAPGGEGAGELWESLVGARLDEPARFIDLLFEKDGGRRAWFYDVVSHLPPAMQQHVMGAELGVPYRRLGRMRALSDVFLRVAPSWRLADRPLWRPLADPAVWLSEVQVRRDGTLAGPLSETFLDATFASEELPDAEAAELALAGSPEPLDAAGLAARVFLTDPGRAHDRMAFTLFAQRVFGDTPPSGMADALTVCRAFARLPALVLSLERMGVSEPRVQAAIVGVADAVTRRGTYEALSMLESAVALVEGVRVSRAIDAAAATRLVEGLAAVPWVGRAFHGAAALWVRDGLVTALGDSPSSDRAGGSEDIDARLIDALAGRPARSAHSTAGPTVTWEGQRYLVDARASERARLEAVRIAQGRRSLDAAVTLAIAAAALTTPDATGVDAAARALDRIAPVEASTDGRAPLARDARDGRQADRAVAEARDTLRLAREAPQDLRRVPRLAHTLAPVASRALADALLAFAYAIHLPAGSGEIEIGRLHERHDFGQSLKAHEARLRTPWALAEPVSGAGAPWHLRGSLLSLDLAMAPRLLRRVSDEPPSPTLHGSDRDAFVANVPLLNAFDVTDESRDRLVASVARGRTRVAALTREAGHARATARAAGLSEWRTEALSWRVVHDPASLDAAFSLLELFWLGEPGSDALGPLDRWGTSLVGITGQLATRLPRARPWEESAGHWGGGLLAAHVADLNLQTAQWLADFSLPSELARGVLSVAVQDLIDRAGVSSPDDWPALVSFVRALPRARFEDYVAALTVEGPLRPAPEEEQ